MGRVQLTVEVEEETLAGLEALARKRGRWEGSWSDLVRELCEEKVSEAVGDWKAPAAHRRRRPG